MDTFSDEQRYEDQIAREFIEIQEKEKMKEIKQLVDTINELFNSLIGEKNVEVRSLIQEEYNKLIIQLNKLRN